MEGSQKERETYFPPVFEEHSSSSEGENCLVLCIVNYVFALSTSVTSITSVGFDSLGYCNVNAAADDDDDPLPAVEGLQISGEPFPGRELQACGYSINGTTRCNFEWVRHLEDGSVQYIDGAKEPTYLVSADDVDTYLAIEVVPIDDRKRKGELVKVFANENRKISCDTELHKHIERNLYNGHATYRVSLSTRYLDLWEPATLLINQEGYRIKCSGPSSAIVTQKFSPSTIVTPACGNPTEFSIIGTGVVEHLLQADRSSQDINCSRDAIVLTMRLFVMKAGEKGKREVYSVP